MSHPAKIDQVAQETGLSIDTIRFYEKQGLLKRSARTESGFRLFGSAVWSGIEFKPNYVEQCREGDHVPPLNAASIAGLARTFSDSSHSGSTLAPAETRSTTTSRCLPWFPAGGSHQPWIAHPRGGDLYFSSLRFKSAPSINLAASRS